MGQLRRVPDPAGGDPAGEHRPAPRRRRLGAALLLPPRRRLDRRGEDRGARLPADRPARRRRARARPALPGAADRGAGAARRRPGQGQPEELDRPARRLHPRDHRPPQPLRRHPPRLPRAALPGGRAALLRDPGQDRALAQPAAARARRRAPRRRARSARCRASRRCSTSASDPAPSPSWRSPTASSSASTSPARPTASSATGRRRTACRSTSRRIRAYRWSDYWDPVYPEAGGRIVLEPEIFYLLLSAEGVSIPPQIAAEMMAYDPTAGELRTHYAGFFDPGFGYDPAGDRHGSRAALEVRARDVPFMVEHRQPVCKLGLEWMEAPAERLYGADLGSNYQGQVTMLSKHFEEQTAGRLRRLSPRVSRPRVREAANALGGGGLVVELAAAGRGPACAGPAARLRAARSRRGGPHQLQLARRCGRATLEDLRGGAPGPRRPRATRGAARRASLRPRPAPSAPSSETPSRSCSRSSSRSRSTSASA